MICIFEDYFSKDPKTEEVEADKLVNLYHRAYPEEAICKFLYSHGNTKLESLLSKVVCNATEPIIVFMDTVPGNKNIKRIYYRLLNIARKHTNVIIIPIVCREFYLLKSVNNTDFVINKGFIQEVVDKEFFKNSSYIESEEDVEFCTNFEKFCKLATKKALKSCYKDIWATQDCKSSKCCKDCSMNNSISQKACDFVYSWDCFISGNLIDKPKESLNIEGMVQLHRKLVDEFNSMSAVYAEIDSDDKSNYFKLPYQK